MALACVLILICGGLSAPARSRPAPSCCARRVVLVLLTSGPLNVTARRCFRARPPARAALPPPGCPAAATVPSWLRIPLSGRWPPRARRRGGACAAGAVYAIPAPPALTATPPIRLQMLALAAGALIALAARLAPAPRRVVVVAAPLLLGLAGGVALRVTDVLLAASWFGATGRTWRADALADQRDAGTLVLIVVALAALLLGGAALRARRRG